MVQHLLWLGKVAAVNHDGKLYRLVEPHQIDVGEFLPVGQNQYRVCILGCLVEVSGVDHSVRWRQHCLGTLPGGGIVGCDSSSRVQKFLVDFDGRWLGRSVQSADSTLLKNTSFCVSFILRISCSSWKFTPRCWATQWKAATSLGKQDPP